MLPTTPRIITGRRFRGGLAACLAMVTATAAGCTAPSLAVRPVSYDVEVHLDVANHTLSGRTVLTLDRLQPNRKLSGAAAIDLKLHPDLTVDNIEVKGASLSSRAAKPPQTTAKDVPEDHPAVMPTTHRLLVTDPVGQIHVTIDYHGQLSQDASAGEKQGQIHNFAMSAHVGEDGIYLDEGGYWYPLVELPEGSDPALALADYDLGVDSVKGFELVAGLVREGIGDDGRFYWSSAFPLERIVLLGGPLKRWTRQHGNITLHTVLDPSKEAVAEDILDASAEYLDKYQPLIGPYPYSDFTLLEAFFSSGFAFPTCTQIVGSQLSAYKQHRRHGYLDHELLHNWYGNGIYVDPNDGNWCEALASYGANYYGFVLDGDEAGARKKRRDQSNFLSAIKPENDKPLGTFGLEGGCGRGIAYSKGAAVFHMIERQIGPKTFFAAMRRLTDERMGKLTNWNHIKAAFEAESGQDLDVFFEQWVRGGGAPLLQMTGADWSPGASEVTVWISQGQTDFVVDVPLRLYYGDRSTDVTVTVDERDDKAVIPCESTGLTAIELDPDYHVFRKLKPAEVMPTSSLPKRSDKLIVVLPTGDFDDAYQTVVDNYTEAVLGEEDDPKEGHQVVVRPADEVTAQELAEGSLLIVGEAVRAPVVTELLANTVCPVTWTQGAFSIEDQQYADPGQAVYFTVHHPDRPEGGISVYCGNSPAALANAGVLPYYANSLLVFETPLTEPTGDDTGGHRPHTQVIKRLDFESHDRIEF
ncbi:MAG: M1 family metallopeptidase [bacterium]|nr:M1 family metallopeptidase [bacterium]